MCDWVFAMALAHNLAPLQVIGGSAMQEKLQTIQVICRDMERRKCPGDKHVPWEAKYLLGQSSAGRRGCISTAVNIGRFRLLGFTPLLTFFSSECIKGLLFSDYASGHRSQTPWSQGCDPVGHFKHTWAGFWLKHARRGQQLCTPRHGVQPAWDIGHAPTRLYGANRTQKHLPSSRHKRGWWRQWHLPLCFQ